MTDPATNHPSPTVIVTGSSSGIGRAVAHAFLERGANVVLNGRNASALADAAQALTNATGATPERLATVAGDIGEARTGAALVQTAVARFGGVDVLVNNAGVFRIERFVDITESELDAILQGNLKGTFLTTQAVVRAMQQAGRGGSIVNIGTVLVDHALGSVPAAAALASKGGVHALTTSLAAELAADDIRVNLVAPGMVRTPLQDGNDEDWLGSVAMLRRIATADEVADAVVYLANARFATGHILNLDGGYVAGRR